MKNENDLNARLDKFKDVDPVKYAEFVRQAQDIEDKKLIDAGQVDQLVKDKVGKFKTEKEEQIALLDSKNKTLEQEAATAKSELNMRNVNDVITNAVQQKGNLNKGALQDVLSRAHHGEIRWNVNENRKLIASTSDGKAVYSKDAVTPLTPAEWVDDIFQSSGYLWQGNIGGGAGGSGSGGGTRILSDDEVASGKFIEDIASGKASASQ